MEHEQIYNRLPPLSPNSPWLVAQDLETENGDQIFFPIHDTLSNYRCRIPVFRGARIQACFHGWVILSKHPCNLEWSLWNPLTSKLIQLPPLIRKGGNDDIINCCLSSPPDKPGSVLLLTRRQVPKLIFCRLDSKKKRWIEMSYAKQLRRATGQDGLLFFPTCCNDKVYALTSFHSLVQIDIVVKDTQVVITILPFMKPYVLPTYRGFPCCIAFLKGSCTQLFLIILGFKELTMKTLGDVYLLKLDMTSMKWKDIKDLKDSIFFVDLARDGSIFYTPTTASELGCGGYIHIHIRGQIIHSYHVKEKTIALHPMPGFMQTGYVSMWEIKMHDYRLEGDDGANSKQEDYKENKMVVTNELNATDDYESDLLRIPFHVLEKLMEFCVGIEYMKFRATCKHCYLAAPQTRWSNKTALRRLQTYSVVSSPWLLVFDTDRDIITLTDPMLGDKYFITTLRASINDDRIYCCRYGWLLFHNGLGCLAFYNPFTCELRKLPSALRYFDSVSFSAPPTSPDCMVVGFISGNRHARILYVNREPFWHTLDFEFGGVDDPDLFRFPTFYGGDIYALHKGELNVFKVIKEGEGDISLSREVVVVEAPKATSCCTENFLVKCDQHLLLVAVGDLGESVEVFKLNDSTKEWEKIDGLGRNVIYICGTACLCIQAKTPEMENKIFFPRLQTNNRKLVFYSLETCRYHTFNGKNIQGYFRDFFGTKYHQYPHVWIEPSWC